MTQTHSLYVSGRAQFSLLCNPHPECHTDCLSCASKNAFISSILSVSLSPPLTSEPRAHVATMALHARGGAFGRWHRRPVSRDINSNSGVVDWHSYKMMCCMNGWLAGESNTGSYCSLRSSKDTSASPMISVRLEFN